MSARTFRRSRVRRVRRPPPLLVSTLVAIAAHPTTTTALQGQTSSRCPHVRILDAADTDSVHWSEEALLVDADSIHRQVIAAALDLLPPLLCQSVRTIAMTSDSSGTWRGKTKPNDRQHLIYLNTASNAWDPAQLKQSGNARLNAAATLMHESAHTATRLLYAVGAAGPPSLLEGRPDSLRWPASARSLARGVIDRTRLDKGLLQEWERMQQSFVDGGLGAGYYGSSWRSAAAADHVGAGFTSAYGGESAREDIAELTAWALAQPLVSGVARGVADDAACHQMNAEAGPAVPGRFAAVYAKLGFLADLGFIDSMSYQSCVGNLLIQAPGEGFFSYTSTGNPSRQYTQGPQAAIGLDATTSRHAFTFDVHGSGRIAGQSLPVDIALKLQVTGSGAQLSEASWPRGLYQIRHPRLAPRSPDGNEFWLTMPDRPSGTFYATRAMVLVSRASSDLVEGSVFLMEGWRPFAPSGAGGVPQTGLPQRATFRIRN